MNFPSFVVVLMTGIMLVGGGVLVAMLLLESRSRDLRGWISSASTSNRGLRGRLRPTWLREKNAPKNGWRRRRAERSERDRPAQQS
jgi:hypothetical protein